VQNPLPLDELISSFLITLLLTFLAGKEVCGKKNYLAVVLPLYYCGILIKVIFGTTINGWIHDEFLDFLFIPCLFVMTRWATDTTGDLSTDHPYKFAVLFSGVGICAIEYFRWMEKHHPVSTVHLHPIVGVTDYMLLATFVASWLIYFNWLVYFIGPRVRAEEESA